MWQPSAVSPYDMVSIDHLDLPTPAHNLASVLFLKPGIWTTAATVDHSAMRGPRFSIYICLHLRGLIQKFVYTLTKHSSWIDSWMPLLLYIHIVTSLMNIQMKFYESVLNGMRVTPHLNQWLLVVRHTPQRHYYANQINVRLNMRGLRMTFC